MLQLQAQTEKIGINTTSPDETVHVIGDIILLESPDGTKKVMLRTSGASGELKSLGDLYLRAEGNEIILNHVPTDGNVGVGKTGPTEMLDVGGAIRISDSDNMTSEEGTVKFADGEFQGYDGTEWKSFTEAGSTIWELALDTSTIVYDGGKVVVGSTANPQELDVTDNVTFRGELHMSSLGGANPTFKMVDNGTTFYMGPVRNGSDYYIQTTKDLIFRTSGNSYSNKLVIKNDGKVGIGDGVTPATLTEALTVDGAVNIGTTTENNPGTIRYTAADGFEGYDDGEWKSLSEGGAVSSPWSTALNGIFYENGSLGVGSTPLEFAQQSVFTFQKTFGSYINNAQASTDPTVGLRSFTHGNASGEKTAIEASSMNGSGTNIGMESTAVGGSINKGLYSHSGSGSNDYSAHFGVGKVIVDDSLGIGLHNPEAKVHLNGDLKMGTSTDDFIEANFINESSDAFGRIFIKDETQSQRISLVAGSFYDPFVDYDSNDASIKLNDNEGENRLRIFADNSSSGLLLGRTDPSDGQYKSMIYALAGDYGTPSLSITNIDFSKTVELIGQSDGGGRINLFGTSGDFGSQLLEIVAKDNSNRGGRITLKNNDAGEAVVIKTAEGGADLKQGVIELMNGTGVRTIKIDGRAGDDDHSHISLWDGVSSDYTIQINSNWGESGNSRIVTDELEIKGGSDLAEYFDVTGNVENIKQGHIVSIDPNIPGALKLSTQKNDKLVAGVISGANGVNTGFMMGQDGSIADGDFPVALTGRVYVYANNECGEIKPGDFLTTSSTSGEAMKVRDIDSAQGSIIGKAMTSIDENGFVLVLVNLQ